MQKRTCIAFRWYFQPIASAHNEPQLLVIVLPQYLSLVNRSVPDDAEPRVGFLHVLKEIQLTLGQMSEKGARGLQVVLDASKFVRGEPHALTALRLILETALLRKVIAHSDLKIVGASELALAQFRSFGMTESGLTEPTSALFQRQVLTEDVHVLLQKSFAINTRSVVMSLLTAISEASTNCRQHAFPHQIEFNRWAVSAVKDWTSNQLVIVICDLGVGATWRLQQGSVHEFADEIDAMTHLIRGTAGSSRKRSFRGEGLRQIRRLADELPADLFVMSNYSCGVVTNGSDKESFVALYAEHFQGTIIELRVREVGG